MSRREFVERKARELSSPEAVKDDPQFERDLRGDHDGPRSYQFLPPADSTPSAAEIESRMS